MKFFLSTPFELHDDNYVLKAMKLCERPRGQGNETVHNIRPDGGEGPSTPSVYPSQVPSQVAHPSVSIAPVRPPTSPPLPGIIKARVKHEH